MGIAMPRLCQRSITATAYRSLPSEQYGGPYRIYEPQLLTRFHPLDLRGDADQNGDVDLQDNF